MTNDQQENTHGFVTQNGKLIHILYDKTTKLYQYQRNAYTQAGIEAELGVRLVPRAKFINVKRNHTEWLHFDQAKQKALWGGKWVSIRLLGDHLGVRYSGDVQQLGKQIVKNRLPHQQPYGRYKR